MIREARRLRLPRLRIGLLMLLAAVGCTPERETRRLFEADGLELVERNAVTRPVRVVTSSLKSSLRNVARGSFHTQLAVRGSTRDARARVSLWAEDFIGSISGRDLGECEASWPPGSESDWQRCEIRIARDLDEAWLRIDYEAPEGSELLVAAPRFEADLARKTLPPVFLVVLDTARADGFEAFNPKSAIGGHLAELARDGVVFSRARSPSSWTRTALATLLTGRSPFTHRVLDRLDVLASEPATLQEALQRAGYVTRGWSSNPNVLARWGFARGFDAFEDVGTRSWALTKPDGDRVIDRVEETISRHGAGGGFFYIHLMDPHQPYEPDKESLAALDRMTGKAYELPAPAPVPVRGESMRASYRRYLAEMLESDQHIGRLVALLRKRGEYDRALIAVVSDHGEEFLDHGGSGHGKTLYEEMLRVPLWLKLPDARRAGTRVDTDVGLVDLPATLLAALGLPPIPESEGRDLLAPATVPAPRLARLKLEGADQGSVVHEGWKLIIDFDAETQRLFDLREDPGERKDRSAEQPARADALLALFESRRFEHERGWHIRACSGAKGGQIEFELRLDAEVSTLETRMLEPGDRVEESAGAQRIALDLALREHPTERVLAKVRPTLPDEDELVILPRGAEPARSGDAIELRGTAGGELAYRLGAAGALERSTRLRPAQHAAAARVSAGTSVRCAHGEAPYLQVWHVDPPSHDTDAVDPALAERLRALGYGE